MPAAGQMYYSIIVAGGSGRRMNADLPKQFMLLLGRPVLMHTIEAFIHCGLNIQVILVLPAEHMHYWAELCKAYQFNIPHTVVQGGNERFYSVKNALEVVTNPKALVAVHDAVRPLVSTDLIHASFRSAETLGTAVAGIPSRDSVRRISAGGSTALDRKTIYLMQTPQVFRAEILKVAYETEYSEELTDDASVVEKAGFAIHIVEGDTQNLKITFPEDIAIAEVLMKKKSGSRPDY